MSEQKNKQYNENWGTELALIPVRALNEYAYCSRLYHFMYIDKTFIHNNESTLGKEDHDKADKRGGKIRRETELVIDGDEIWKIPPKNLKFSSKKYGLIGVLDALEENDGQWVPVEAKKSKMPSVDVISWNNFRFESGAWSNDQLQLFGQMALLRDNGFTCEKGCFYYRGSKKRVYINWTDKNEQALLALISSIRDHDINKRPLPLLNSIKCIRCSLNEICLPDETNHIVRKEKGELARQVLPGRYDKGVVHVVSHSARIGVSGDELTITERDTKKQKISLRDIQSVSVYGNAQISTQALHALLRLEITVLYLSQSGWLNGYLSPFSGKNTHLRKAQMARFPQIGLELSKQLVSVKISNQRTLIRRNGLPEITQLKSLKKLSNDAINANKFASLRGFEGAAARIYFMGFGTMLKAQQSGEVLFKNRNRRPPKDPVNATLSFCYSMLVKDCVTAIIATGLDPMVGFFHVEEKGRPALALDIMESYRPVIADSAVIRAWNTGMITLNDFQQSDAGVIMKKKAKRAIIQAYEQRMNTMIRHPKFGYNVNYRRMLEVEVRLLGRFLEGELDEWKPLKIR